MASQKQSEQGPKTVKAGRVTLTVRPWRHHSGSTYWRAYYTNDQGEPKFITRADRDDCIKAAGAKAREIHNGVIDIADLEPDQLRLVRAFLNLSPTWGDIERLAAFKGGSKVRLPSVVDKWAAMKLAELNGKESRHLESTRKWLEKFAEHFADVPPDRIDTDSLQAYLESVAQAPKTRIDSRQRIVSLWNYARVHGLFDSPAADRLPKYKDGEEGPIRYLKPEEMKLLLGNVKPEFLPWLVLAAFSGLRSEEIRSSDKRKGMLDWSAIKRSKGIIDLPAAMAKGRKRRIIPITPTLDAWLEHLDPPKHGPVSEHNPTRKETARLGLLLPEKEWPRNCLRHSYGSYRAATEKNLPALAIEMGNSLTVIENHYRESVEEPAALKFWAIRPCDLA